MFVNCGWAKRCNTGQIFESRCRKWINFKKKSVSGLLWDWYGKDLRTSCYDKIVAIPRHPAVLPHPSTVLWLWSPDVISHEVTGEASRKSKVLTACFLGLFCLSIEVRKVCLKWWPNRLWLALCSPIFNAVFGTWAKLSTDRAALENSSGFVFRKVIVEIITLSRKNRSANSFTLKIKEALHTKGKLGKS